MVFADVVDHLAVATFRLRERKEPGLTFEDVFKQEFTKLLKQLRQELRHFDGRSAVADSLHGVREACKIISALAVWRNDRIHARVHMSENGYALYHWRTRRRLEISSEQIEQKINMAIKAMVELEAHAPHLVHLLKWDEEFEKLFSNLPELSEPAGRHAGGGCGERRLGSLSSGVVTESGTSLPHRIS